MKKLFLSAILFLMGSVALGATYQPAPGPMSLADRGQTFNARGAIMEELIRNQNNPAINAARRAIVAFDRRPNLRPYQEIMTNLSTSTETALAVDALKGFETVIMHLYHYRAYLHWDYDPVRSIFVSGIRSSWFDPRCYGPKSWVSDNDPALKQLIDELNQVASVMYNHSTTESVRLKAVVHSYRHWRLNLALSCAAYLMFDIYNHSYDQSIIKQFGDRGLMNTPGILYNHASNFGYGVKYGYQGTKFLAKNYWNYVVKPIGKFTLGGWNYAVGSAPTKADDEKKKNINPINPNAQAAKKTPVAIQNIVQSPQANVVKQQNQTPAPVDELAYLTAPSEAQVNQEFAKIEQAIAQIVQPKVVIDKKFVDQGDALSTFVQRNTHELIQDGTQEDYAVLKELAAECKAYELQQEQGQVRSVESVDLANNTLPSSSTELVHVIAQDHNVAYQPEPIKKPYSDDPYYVENPLINFGIFSPKEWAALIGGGLLAGYGIGHLVS